VWHNSTRICSKSIEFRHSAQKIKENAQPNEEVLGGGGVAVVAGGLGEGCSDDKCNSAPEQVCPQCQCACVCVGEYLSDSLETLRSFLSLPLCVCFVLVTHQRTHAELFICLTHQKGIWQYFYYVPELSQPFITLFSNTHLGYNFV